MASKVLTKLEAEDWDGAAELLLDEHRAAIRGWLTALLRNETDVDDVLANVGIRVFRHIQKVDRTPAESTRRFRAWIFEIARREAYRLHAKRARIRAHEQRLGTHDEALLRATGPGPSTNLRDRDEREKTAERLEALLAELRPQDAMLIVLRYREELSYAEIADKLSLPDRPLSEATIRQRVARATRRLKTLGREDG